MINDGMRGQRYFAPFNYVIELQEMCKQKKKYIYKQENIDYDGYRR